MISNYYILIPLLTFLILTILDKILKEFNENKRKDNNDRYRNTNRDIDSFK